MKLFSDAELELIRFYSVIVTSLPNDAVYTTEEETEEEDNGTNGFFAPFSDN